MLLEAILLDAYSICGYGLAGRRGYISPSLFWKGKSGQAPLVCLPYVSTRRVAAVYGEPGSGCAAPRTRR